MRKLLLAVVLVLMASGAQASSYLKTDGNSAQILCERTFDFCVVGQPHPYAGADLGPSTDLPGVNLFLAVLTDADLDGANLASANLRIAILTHADLNGANLIDANLVDTNLNYADLSGATLIDALMPDALLTGADLTGTDLMGADLRGVSFLGTTIGTPNYNALTNFGNTWTGAKSSSAPFDPVAAGWNLVPEPTTSTLFTVGVLLGLTRRRTRLQKGD